MGPEILDKSLPLFREAAGLLAGTLLPELRIDSLRKKKEQEISLAADSSGEPIRLSIVIPTFNREELAQKAIESACNQPIPGIEVIIVNDAGKRFSEETHEKLSRLDTPVTIINHLRNHGLGASRNTGALAARGKWLMVLDDDDVFVLGGPYLLLEEAERSGSAFVIGDHIRQYKRNGIVVKNEYHRRSDNAFEMLQLENWIVCGTFIIERDLFVNLGGYREDFRVHEDYHLHIRVTQTAQMRHIPSPVFVYNITENIERMNNSLRPYWFATSALNHELFRLKHAQDQDLKLRQKINQYEHIKKAIADGCSQDMLVKLIFAWWDALLQAGIAQEINYELPIVAHVCPQLVELLNCYSPVPREAE